jgi:hypothetical protein
MKSTSSIALLSIVLLASCGQNSDKKTISNSQDTTSVNRAGGPPIRNTATINKDRRDSAKLPARNSGAKGNADPSGHIKNN